MPIKFAVHNRWSGAVQFEAEIDCEENASVAVRIGLAVRWAIKSRADLSGAYLSGADLSRADLSRANLSDADLRRANLSGADLSHAYLSGADLSHADLSGADLSRADLSRANLSDAYLSGADLSRAYLSGAYLSRANLSGADGVALAIAKTRILPEGDLIGWKKCAGDVLVKLRIPADARRTHAFGRKCRAEFADVLEIIGADVAVSRHDGKTEYRVGKRMVPHEFDENWQEECAGGIHFFITREEAEVW